MRKGDVVFRVRGLRFTELDPTAVAAYVIAVSALLGPSRFVRITGNTVVLRRVPAMTARNPPSECPT